MVGDYISREAAISNIRDEGVLGGDYDAYEREEDVVDTLNSIPAADVVERPRWIPVTERLPDYPGRFMCYYEVNDYGENGHCIDWGMYDPDDGWYVSGVTHWMPLPEPPEEEE